MSEERPSEPFADRIRGAARALTGLSASVLGPIASAVAGAAADFASPPRSAASVDKQDESTSEFDFDSAGGPPGPPAPGKSSPIAPHNDKNKKLTRRITSMNHNAHHGKKSNGMNGVNERQSRHHTVSRNHSKKDATVIKEEFIKFAQNQCSESGPAVKTPIESKLNEQRNEHGTLSRPLKRGKRPKNDTDSVLEPFITTRNPYDTGIFPVDDDRNFQVVTPRWIKVVELKDNGHPDLSKLPDEPAPTKKRGREDLSDERFYKRHLPAEINERKKKKYNSNLTQFDFQQEIRRKKHEEKMKAKLREHLGEVNPEEEKRVPAKPFSFWPDISADHCKTILVENELPVVAFGCPVPKFERRVAFSLPQAGINAVVLPKPQPERAQRVQKTLTDGPAAASGRRKRIPQKRYDPDSPDRRPTASTEK